MTSLIGQLEKIWDGDMSEFLVHEQGTLSIIDVLSQPSVDISRIPGGQVVALIGDFDPSSIKTLLQLFDRNAIVVPLTTDTKNQHEYFFDQALVDFVIDGGKIRKISHNKSNDLLRELRSRNHPGLVLFSSGTTGKPKAILHDFEFFISRFQTPRPSFRTMNFLLFDHIGGINTLFHTLFNRGTIVAPKVRQVNDVLKMCDVYGVEVLPTTPTFLRMMLMSGLIPDGFPKSIKIVTYGTERMDQGTLDSLAQLLPEVDFRQTYGMSELGIVRVKSESSNSLYMKIGGEGIETRVNEGILEIRSSSRMLGYLNAESPFDKQGWYSTGDLVIERDGFYKIIGRTNEVINVGGLKFMASEVENTALKFDGVELAKAQARQNPITGQHVELLVQANDKSNVSKKTLEAYLSSSLPNHMVPRKVTISIVPVGHRFKRE